MDFSVTMPTHMVYIATAKRIKESKKLTLTFQNFEFSEFEGVGWLGDGRCGIRISSFNLLQQTASGEMIVSSCGSASPIHG